MQQHYDQSVAARLVNGIKVYSLMTFRQLPGAKDALKITGAVEGEPGQGEPPPVLRSATSAASRGSTPDGSGAVSARLPEGEPTPRRRRRDSSATDRLAALPGRSEGRADESAEVERELEHYAEEDREEARQHIQELLELISDSAQV